MAWLLERIAAIPITTAMLQFFGVYPRGPIIPDECLESKKLPSQFGTFRSGSTEVMASKILDLAVSDNGEPIILTVVAGNPALYMNGQQSLIPWNQEFLFSEVHEIQFGQIKILRIHNGIPQICIYKGDLNKDWTMTMSVYLNTEHLYDIVADLLSISFTQNCTHRFLAYSPSNPKSQGQIFIGGDDEPLGVDLNGKIEKIVQGSDGLLYLFSDGVNGKGPRKNIISSMDLNTGEVIQVLEGNPRMANLADIVPSGDSEKPILIIYKSGSVYQLDLNTSKGTVQRKDLSFDSNTTYYKSFLTRESFGDELITTAFIGAPSRDKKWKEKIRYCWYINGIEQIAFEHVSNLFVDDDGVICYYAVLGKDLIKMRCQLN